MTIRQFLREVKETRNGKLYSVKPWLYIVYMVKQEHVVVTNLIYIYI